MKKEVYKELHKVLSRHDIYLLQTRDAIKYQKGKLVLNVEGIYNLAIVYVKQEKWNQALKLFDFCHKLNPHHTGACLYLLKDALYKDNYKGALDYVESLYDNPKAPLKTANFFLFLLQYLVALPKELEEKVANFKLSDFINIKTKDAKEFRHSYRLAAVKGYFDLAEKIASQENVMKNTEDLISLKLFKDINKLYATIKENVSKKMYGEVVNILSPLGDSIPYELKIILNLAKRALEIESTLIVPNISVSNDSNLDQALNEENYNLALTLTDDEIIKQEIQGILDIITEINYTSFDKMEAQDTSMDSNITLIDIDTYIASINLIGLEETFKKYNLTEEEQLELTILYAEECFKAKLFTLGDKYLKQAQKSEFKNPRLIALLEEVSQKRHIYKSSRAIPESKLIREKVESL